MTTYIAVWGCGSTGLAAGEIGRFETLEAAEAAIESFFATHGDNTALGAWVRREQI